MTRGIGGSRPFRGIDVMEVQYPEAYAAWVRYWTTWVTSSLTSRERRDMDPKRPWVQALGDAPLRLSVKRGVVGLVRPAVPGHDEVDWRYIRGEWTDYVNG